MKYGPQANSYPQKDIGMFVWKVRVSFTPSPSLSSPVMSSTKSCLGNLQSQILMASATSSSTFTALPLVTSLGCHFMPSLKWKLYVKGSGTDHPSASAPIASLSVPIPRRGWNVVDPSPDGPL